MNIAEIVGKKWCEENDCMFYNAVDNRFFFIFRTEKPLAGMGTIDVHGNVIKILVS